MCEFQRKAACKFLDLQAAFLRKLRADFADAEPLSKYADLCHEQDRLSHYIGFLDGRQQDVIRRYYFEQQSWGEIADGMGSTPRTVQRLRQQAVEELANLYAFADGILRR